MKDNSSATNRDFAPIFFGFTLNLKQYTHTKWQAINFFCSFLKEKKVHQKGPHFFSFFTSNRFSCKTFQRKIWSIFPKTTVLFEISFLPSSYSFRRSRNQRLFGTLIRSNPNHKIPGGAPTLALNNAKNGSPF